jgi:hypothetical protein
MYDFEENALSSETGAQIAPLQLNEGSFLLWIAVWLIALAALLPALL